MLGISHTDHNTNEYVWQQVSVLTGHHDLLLSTVKYRKLSLFGRVSRHDTLPTIILQGTVDLAVDEEDSVNRGGTTSSN